jgi:glutamate 5-kinase
VINENDSVVTDEIMFGDNDTLAALVANLIEATTLLLLTDQPGLMTADPSQNPGAELVRTLSARDTRLDEMAGGSASLGRGGMVTKVGAARIAARSGASTVIADGAAEGLMTNLAAGIVSGSLLTADSGPLVARKQWLATLPVKGRLVLDDGACRVLMEEGRSLLAVGVTAASGDFTRGDMVACVDSTGVEIARGLVNYSDGEVVQLLRVSSDRIESVLGYVAEEELIHRDNMVFS